MRSALFHLASPSVDAFLYSAEKGGVITLWGGNGSYHTYDKVFKC